MYISTVQYIVCGKSSSTPDMKNSAAICDGEVACQPASARAAVLTEQSGSGPSALSSPAGGLPPDTLLANALSHVRDLAIDSVSIADFTSAVTSLHN